MSCLWLNSVALGCPPFCPTLLGGGAFFGDLTCQLRSYAAFVREGWRVPDNDSAWQRFSYFQRFVVSERAHGILMLNVVLWRVETTKKMTQHVYMSTVFIAFNILFCRLWGGQVQNWLNMAALFVCELKMDTAFVREREGRKNPLHGWNYWKLNLSTAFIPRKYLASLAVVILIQTWVKMPISWFAQRIVF